MKKYSIVCFLAREHGLNVFKEILSDERFNIACVFTHKKKTKSECEARKERDDYIEFKKICEKNNIDIYSVDSKSESLVMDKVISDLEHIDFIISVSWRRLISKNILDKAKIKAINMHRGKLPEYAGALPVLRSLKDKNFNLIITAHEMTEVIDDGEILSTSSLIYDYNDTLSAEENTEIAKAQMTHLFGPLFKKSIEIILEKK